MTLQNRVDPSGAICADPARGEFMGNRGGPLHDSQKRIVRHQKNRSWIICLTEFRGRKRLLMQPGRYTELFFLDEVTALAAGHRPCFECRRKAALAFAEAFGADHDESRPLADTMDRQLAAERSIPAGDISRAIAPEAIAALPDGAMLMQSGAFYALRGGRLLPWSFAGYREPLPLEALGSERVFLITPASTVAAMSNGYHPVFHTRAWCPAS